MPPLLRTIPDSMTTSLSDTFIKSMRTIYDKFNLMQRPLLYLHFNKCGVFLLLQLSAYISTHDVVEDHSPFFILGRIFPKGGIKGNAQIV